MRTQESKKLVALNYQKFHSIKTHTSRGHKKWMSIIKTVFSDAFFYILGGFLCRFFFFFVFCIRSNQHFSISAFMPN